MKYIPHIIVDPFYRSHRAFDPLGIRSMQSPYPKAPCSDLVYIVYIHIYIYICTYICMYMHGVYT